VSPKASRKRRPPKARRIKRSNLTRRDVTRAEYNGIIEVLNQQGEIVDGLRRELEVQFKRIAQMQSELDEVGRLLAKARS
jgi:hypothetical protein